jgi:hypothetical protein
VDLEKIMDEGKVMTKEGKSIALPKNEEEISRIISFAIENRLKVLITGNSTRIDYGPPLGYYDLVLSLSHFRGDIICDEIDLYFKALSGVRVNEAINYCLKRGLILPMDSPRKSESTVGGSTSMNLIGLNNSIFGPISDLVLGMKFINGKGKAIKSGGDTWKFSSGYKFYKLLTGSFGLLGAITQISMKVFPVFEEQIFLYKRINDVNEINRALSCNPTSLFYILGNERDGIVAMLAGTSKGVKGKEAELIGYEKIEREEVEGIMNSSFFGKYMATVLFPFSYFPTLVKILSSVKVLNAYVDLNSNISYISCQDLTCIRNLFKEIEGEYVEVSVDRGLSEHAKPFISEDEISNKILNFFDPYGIFRVRK